MPSDPRIDALFELPLDGFVAARNALAKTLAQAGDKARAAEVKALAKPSVASWTLNQVVRRDRALASSFLGACDRLAAAQLAPRTADGGETSFQEAQTAQRTLLHAVLDVAGVVLEGAPQKRALIDRIARTLRAVARDTSVRDAFLEGRLTDDLEEPGFDLFAARVGLDVSAPVSSSPLRLVPAPVDPAPPDDPGSEPPSESRPRPRAPSTSGTSETWADDARRHAAAARRSRIAALESEAQRRRAAVLEAQSSIRTAKAELEAARSAHVAAAHAQAEAAAARDRALEAVEAERRRLADAEARAEETARAYDLAVTRASLEASRLVDREKYLTAVERAEADARAAEREAEARVASEVATD